MPENSSSISPLWLALLPLLGTIAGGIIASLTSFWVTRVQVKAAETARQEAREDRLFDRKQEVLRELETVCETHRAFCFKEIESILEDAPPLTAQEEVQKFQLELQSQALTSRLGDEMLFLAVVEYMEATNEMVKTTTDDEDAAMKAREGEAEGRFVTATNELYLRIGRLSRME